MTSIKTSLTELLGIDKPIMLAGMGGIASKELVAAVSNAGGFGTWGCATAVANKDVDGLREEMLEMKRLCNGKPFGVDILVHGSDGGVMEQLIDVFAEGGAKAFISGRGFPRKDVIEKFHAKGMVVGMIAGKVKHAVDAVNGGVDFVVVQGHEGGGHTGQVALTVLLPQIVDAVGGKVPVVAAGGIYDGRGLAAALSYGASGVWVGTRFMLTPESNTHPKYKEQLLKASSDDTTVTRAYTGKPMRVLKNSYQKYYDANPDKIHPVIQVAVSTKDGAWKLHGGDDNLTAEDWDKQAFVTGQCIGAIKELKSAG